MSSKLSLFLAALCLYSAAFWIYAPVVQGDPYHYDEADYMWAGKQGFAANYTDRHGLSFVEFVRKGLELSRDSGKRQSFSEYIRSTGDIGMYRHYHGPMYAYWLALMQHTGATRESVFRGSGLLIHGASAMLILFGFWAIFPSLPRPAALAACSLFIFNKTALTAATAITQHGIFTLVCIAALFAASLFLRNLETRWFYATMALVGLAFCAVETAVLIFPALGLAMLADRRRVRERWPSVRKFAGLVLKGFGFFFLAIFVFWPKGILQLGMAKGFLTLAYMTVYRKNFSPIGPLQLFAVKFETSPWEFSMLIAGTIAAFFLWRRFAHRWELLPWLAFIVVFFAVLLKITLPYTYYYAPLTAALTVAAGAACGELWNRMGAPWRFAVPLAVAASIAGTTVQFRALMKEAHDSRPFELAVKEFIQEHPVEAGHRLYLPFQLVPPMHYYFPDMKTVGYDFDFPIHRLVDGLSSPDAAGIMLCEAQMCGAIDMQLPGFSQQKTLLDSPGPNGQPFYVVRMRKPGLL